MKLTIATIALENDASSQLGCSYFTGSFSCFQDKPNVLLCRRRLAVKLKTSTTTRKPATTTTTCKPTTTTTTRKPTTPPKPPSTPKPTNKPCGCKSCGPGGEPCTGCAKRDALCRDLNGLLRNLERQVRQCVCGQPDWLL
ncbi:GM25279 [Drosophila sechellia]|uniref:GM25279 n=1 Tax=Drosophila sechellia TaxID=7238 RepID=B4HEF1_DROSE|nr:GM25279 [Drosophila sechellia]